MAITLSIFLTDFQNSFTAGKRSNRRKLEVRVLPYLEENANTNTT